MPLWARSAHIMHLWAIGVEQSLHQRPPELHHDLANVRNLRCKARRRSDGSRIYHDERLIRITAMVARGQDPTAFRLHAKGTPAAVAPEIPNSFQVHSRGLSHDGRNGPRKDEPCIDARSSLCSAAWLHVARARQPATPVIGFSQERVAP